MKGRKAIESTDNFQHSWKKKPKQNSTNRIHHEKGDGRSQQHYQTNITSPKSGVHCTIRQTGTRTHNKSESINHSTSTVYSSIRPSVIRRGTILTLCNLLLSIYRTNIYQTLLLIYIYMYILNDMHLILRTHIFVFSQFLPLYVLKKFYSFLFLE